jgi:hypothetical protein
MRRPNPDHQRWIWVLVWTTAVSTRVAAAIWLPNAEQDGYSYAEIIRNWSHRFADGTFGLSGLFGFWLPGFQLVGSVANLVVRDPLLAGKLVSCLCGALNCVLVYALALRVTRNSVVALCAFIAILLAPLQLIYSAAAMTDVPFDALVLASVWFASRKQWLLAAICGGLSETVRLEGWALLLALPVLQLLVERKISILTVVILIIVPTLWLAISRYATGDWLGYFAKRARYQNAFLQSWPTRRGFDPADVSHDIDYLLFGANGVALLGLVATGAWVALKARRPGAVETITPLCLAAYGGAIAAFLFLGYMTKRQPVMLPRYGLIFFSLGIPSLVWLGQELPRLIPSWLVRNGIVVVAMLLLLRNSARQLPVLAKLRSEFAAQQQIASRLASVIGRSACFSDDPAVRVLSGLPAAQFLRSEGTPSSAAASAAAFDKYLRERQVDFLVFMQTEDSLPVKFHPRLNDPGSASAEGFELLEFARSAFGPDVLLYRTPAN